MRDGGTAFLTTAFQTAGVLAADNRVIAIDRCAEVGGGSTGRKLSLSVRYRRPAAGLHTELFVKFSRDFDDPVRDRGRTQMEQEVRLAALALDEAFPIPVPRPQFGDYHRESGTGILIAERISFGANGIERQYEKCLDYRLPDPFGHYRALLTAVGRLAGTQQSGRLPHRTVDRFPLDLAGATVGERAPMTADKLHRRLDRLADFATTHPCLLPERVRDPAFLGRLAREAPRVLAHEPAVWQYLAGNADYIALCHRNANVDNAWFFTDAAGDAAVRTDGLGLRGPDERGDGRLGRAVRRRNLASGTHISMICCSRSPTRYAAAAEPTSIPPNWAGRCCCTQRLWGSPGCSTCQPGWRPDSDRTLRP